LHSVGQSRPSPESRITSFGSGLRVAFREAQIITVTSGLLATRSGCDTMTAGCGSGQPGGCQLKMSQAFIPRLEGRPVNLSGARRIPA
jgi:hypothetical protein